jgi:hypothetical protein
MSGSLIKHRAYLNVTRIKKNKNRYNKDTNKNNKISLLKFVTKINTGDIGYRGEWRWVTGMGYRESKIFLFRKKWSALQGPMWHLAEPM